MHSSNMQGKRLGERCGYAGAEHSEHTYYRGGDLQILQFRIGDLAVNLGQGFEAAHGQQRVTTAFEEIVVDVDFLHIEHMSPNVGQHFFE